MLPETTLSEHQHFDLEVGPYCWVPEAEVTRRLERQGWLHCWLLGWRNIASSTNERTAIPTIIPLGGSADTFLLIFPLNASPPQVAALYGQFSSLPFDYVAKQSVGGIHLKSNVIRQLPFSAPHFYTEPRLAFITPKVLELTHTSHSLAPFARDLGHDGAPLAWDEDRRALLCADLDAFYTRAHGLTCDELRYILDPADVEGPDYPSETFRVLKEKEIRHHGEYRTSRPVLAAWDRMEASGEFAAMEM